MGKDILKDRQMSALEAQFEAQKIAFAPVIFQVARSMRDLKILDILFKHKDGLTLDELSELSNIPRLNLQVLCESAASANIIYEDDEKIFISKIGLFIRSDEMTQANLNFNHFVNYMGLQDLDKSIFSEKPEGLKHFGSWDTIYPALSSLPENVKKAWLEFDHFYSNKSFEEAIDILESLNPKSVLDIGGNTGKFAMAYRKQNMDISITVFDLPQQIKMLKQNIYENNISNISTVEANILLEDTKIPKGFDIVWMSQFLDCFSHEQIVDILKKVKLSMSENTQVMIMEPFWNRQDNKTAAFCIINTSPYFTALANGKSKMFKFEDLECCINEAGLKIEQIYDNIGKCQSILRCKKG